LVLKKKNEFKVPFDYLNHRFFDFIQITFWAAYELEIKFLVLCNHQKISIFEFLKSYF